MKRKMKSKRHNVYLVDAVIEKHFTSSKAFYKELHMLSQLTFPEIFSYSEEDLVIRMTYIPGQTLLEVLAHYEEIYDVDKAFEVMIKAMDTLNHFHERFQNVMRFYDMNLRNFLVSDEVHMIDYETVKTGDIKLDYIDMIAMVMHYDPLDTPFKSELFIKLKNEVLKRGIIIECEFDTLYTNAVANIQRRRY